MAEPQRAQAATISPPTAADSFWIGRVACQRGRFAMAEPQRAPGGDDLAAHGCRFVLDRVRGLPARTVRHG